MTNAPRHDPRDDLGRLRIQSPIGPLLLWARGPALHRIDFLDPSAPTAVPQLPDEPGSRTTAEVLESAAAQLTDYFDAKRTEFELRHDPDGTPFQLGVWEALPRIPYGGTLSYAELAALVGRPRAIRAVGAANGANPLPIVLPCHRVIGSDGDLTGYGGGLPAKRRLLDMESGRRTLLPE